MSETGRVRSTYESPTEIHRSTSGRVSSERQLLIDLAEKYEGTSWRPCLDAETTVEDWLDVRALLTPDEVAALEAALTAPARVQPWTTPELDHYCGRCPACGEFCDYCQGHGDVGDPAGALILRWHDQGTHSACHALSDCS